MKAEYSKPEIEVIEVEVTEVMASSDPKADGMNALGFGDGGKWNEEKSSDSFWD